MTRPHVQGLSRFNMQIWRIWEHQKKNRTQQQQHQQQQQSPPHCQTAKQLSARQVLTQKNKEFSKCLKALAAMPHRAEHPQAFHLAHNLYR